jgi:hypothetical protein
MTVHNLTSGSACDKPPPPGRIGSANAVVVVVQVLWPGRTMPCS